MTNQTLHKNQYKTKELQVQVHYSDRLVNWRERFPLAKDQKWIEGVQKKIRTMNSAVSFNEEEHRYFYKGEEMISVSKRIDFMNGEGFAYMKGTEIMEDAMARGTMVHHITEQHDLGIEDMDIPNQHEVIQPYLRAYKKFLVEEDPIYIGAEVRIAKKDWLTSGTIDRIAVRINNANKYVITIYDIKTGKHKYKDELQLTLYEKMLRSTINKRCAIEKKLIYIDNEGKYKIRRVI